MGPCCRAITLDLDQKPVLAAPRGQCCTTEGSRAGQVPGDVDVAPPIRCHAPPHGLSAVAEPAGPHESAVVPDLGQKHVTTTHGGQCRTSHDQLAIEAASDVGTARAVYRHAVAYAVSPAAESASPHHRAIALDLDQKPVGASPRGQRCSTEGSRATEVPRYVAESRPVHCYSETLLFEVSAPAGGRVVRYYSDRRRPTLGHRSLGRHHLHHSGVGA